MSVELDDLRKEFGELTAVDGVSLTIEDGEFVTLVGPSGCGKTTTLRMIAGLEMPTSGSISFGDRDVTTEPPQNRNVAMVFQNYALYPHMTAERNMTFALEDEGDLSKAEITETIQETAEMLGIEDHLSKKPDELSGGQQQRVALGRSIVRDPEVFLLDEPLSNLDAKLRDQMQTELRRIHQELKTTTIYVTHDQEEAMTMSDRIVVMNDGQIQQVDSPDYTYNHPANEFVAGFIGNPAMNFFECEAADDGLHAGPFRVTGYDEVADRAVTLGIRPEHVELDRDGGGDVSGVVDVFELKGGHNIVYVDLDGGDELVVQVPSQQKFDTGETVTVSLLEDRVHLFDAEGEALT